MHDIIGTLSVLDDIGFKINYQIWTSTPKNNKLLFPWLNARVDTMFHMFPVDRGYVYFVNCEQIYFTCFV